MNRLLFIVMILLLINLVQPQINNYINNTNKNKKLFASKDTNYLKNLENKYELTYKTKCSSVLNIVFKFNNYYFSNTTSSYVIEENGKYIFVADNMFKNSNEDISLEINNVATKEQQILSYTFKGLKYDTNNVYKVNFIMEECSNFKNYIQYSYTNDVNFFEQISKRIYIDDNNLAKLNIPNFDKFSEQRFKLFLIENDVIIMNSYLTIGLSIIILIFLMYQ